MLKKIALAVALVACMAIGSMAQDTSGITFYYGVNYFSNAQTGGPDQTLRIVNPGIASSPTHPYNPVDVCAFIYVFDRNQQLLECCGCRLTPNGLRQLSVNDDLTDNPLTGITLTDGALKIVAHTVQPATDPVIAKNLAVNGAFSSCDPSRIKNPVFGLNAWITHLQDTGAETETQVDFSVLTVGEARRLTFRCKSILINASGSGVCSCGFGGLADP